MHNHQVGRFYFGVLSVGAAEDEVDIESVLRRELSPLFSHCVSETPRSMFYDAGARECGRATLLWRYPL